MLKPLLDPKIDFVFKQIFGSKQHPKVLISFLNATLKPTLPITQVEIQNTDLEKLYIEDKFSRLDVKAITSNHEVINVEIQLKNEYNMQQRALYEMRAKRLRDEISALNKAKREGMEEGLQQGSKQKAIEIAKSLIDLLPSEIIAEKTGLSIKEVKDLL